MNSFSPPRSPLPAAWRTNFDRPGYLYRQPGARIFIAFCSTLLGSSAHEFFFAAQATSTGNLAHEFLPSVPNCSVKSAQNLKILYLVSQIGLPQRFEPTDGSIPVGWSVIQ